MKVRIKSLFCGLFMVYLAPVWCQNDIPVSKEIVVNGAIKNSLLIKVDDLGAYRQHEIGDFEVLNHLGVRRNTLKSVKGVLLRDVLKSVELDEKSPKLFSEFYLVMKASDGYKVTFSWNEVFNSSLSDKIFLVTEKDGLKATETDDYILLIHAGDINTGRRHIKSLAEISFRRVP